MTTEQRFWEKVDKRGPDDCWLWTGASLSCGYGAFWYQKRVQPASRVSWMMLNGDPPEGFWVLHRCDNRKCVNPSHLFVGTPYENTMDMVKKERCRAPKGSDNAFSKLTADKVVEIRMLHASGEMQSVLSHRFGVSRNTIKEIVHRRKWKHVA